jgi:hypothetical protein
MLVRMTPSTRLLTRSVLAAAILALSPSVFAEPPPAFKAPTQAPPAYGKKDKDWKDKDHDKDKLDYEKKKKLEAKLEREEQKKKLAQKKTTPEVREELRTHARREAELQRIAELAKSKGDTATELRANKLLVKENTRHEKAMKKLGAWK